MLTEPLDTLKPREIEILELMAQGRSNQEIAEQLFLSRQTVRWYNKQIYSKLGTSRRIEAVELGRKFGLIGVPENPAEKSNKHQLPSTSGPFIGREEDINALTDVLERPETRLLSIIASGGMGKSRLSLELGHLLCENYSAGAAFIDLTAIRRPEDLAEFTVMSMGLNLNSSLSPEEVLYNYCREKELLLIFDNFEHILSGAALLSDLLAAAPQVKIITSSRERLNLRIETTYYLGPVVKKGAELFLEVAEAMHPKFVPSEEERVDVQKTVALVGGLPLALVLAATWLDTLSIAEIAAEITANLDFLTAEMGDMPERQRSIHAVIDPTWKRLTADAQHAFMYASVFRGGFTRQQFQQVTGASVRQLQTLLKHSMVHHGYERRYEMHPLLRQYAREKLDNANKADHARKEHLKTFSSYAQEQTQRMYGETFFEALTALNAEHDNFRAALDWAFSGKVVTEGVALTLTLNRFWDYRSLMQEAVHYTRLAIRLKPNEAELHARLSFYLDRLGQAVEADEHLHQAIRLAEESNSPEALAISYRYLAKRYMYSKGAEETETILQKVLVHAEEAKSPRELAAYHATNALFLKICGRPPEIVLEETQKALKIQEELGEVMEISRTVYNKALEYHRLGDTETAKDLCEQSLDLKRKLGDRAGVARRLSVLAIWDIMDEELEQAANYLSESHAINKELGEDPRLEFTLFIKGLLCIVTGAYDEAQKALEESLSLVKKTENDIAFEARYGVLALLNLVQAKSDRALPYIVKAFDTSGNTIFFPWTAATAFAVYSFQKDDLSASVPIAAVLHREIEVIAGVQPIVTKYFLQPLIYRIKQQIGEKAWQDAIAARANITIDQVTVEIKTYLSANH
jgi:predicted ATPase/DNA-binding CsgD family transcriptional regulator